MKSYEASGRTVEEAISSALAENGLSIGDVSVEILEEGSKGLFGLFGSKEARVRLTLNEDDGSSMARDLFRDSLSTTKSAPPKKEAQKSTRQPAKQPERRVEEKAVDSAPDTEKPVQEKPAQPKPARARKPREQKPREARPVREETVQDSPVRQPRVLTDANDAPETSPAGVAKAFLQELTKLMGLEITVSVALDEEGHVFATLDGDPQGILIGRRGETLDALQYLTSLNVNKNLENYVRVTLDSEGYRQKREDALIRLANRMANRARKTGRRVSMEPMNPYERRIFHSALQASQGITTHSEGEEPNRHIVITPVKQQGGAPSSED